MMRWCALLAALCLLLAGCSSVSSQPEVCSTCEGSGKAVCTWCSGTGEVTCSSCHGSGQLAQSQYAPDFGGGGGSYQTYTTCYACSGSGRVLCTGCLGDGKIG